MSQQTYIPLDNKYTKIYFDLVESRRNMRRTFSNFCGYEKHHIVPKSLGGSNKKDNMVILTPREHCIAHMLLARMYQGTAKAKMIYALMSMAKFRNKNRSTISARLFETLKSDYLNQLKDPDVSKYRSDLAKLSWNDERKQRQAEITRKQWQDGPKRASFASDAYKQKKSRQMKERWEDPSYRQWQTEITLKQWQDNPPIAR